jgi:hypothetical protein
MPIDCGADRTLYLDEFIEKADSIWKLAGLPGVENIIHTVG